MHHDGWTADEILAWEQFSLQMMLKPVIMAMPEDESGFEEECEKPPVLLSGFTRIPRNKFVTLLPLIPNPRNAKERKEAKVVKRSKADIGQALISMELAGRFA